MKWNTEINLDEHNVWFTADLHLFHTNILHMNHRPFETCDEMYEYIVNEWNSKVKDEDYVFILGDVLWGSNSTHLQNFAKKVKGKICIVLGNHDKEKTRDGNTGSNFDWFYAHDRADYIKIKSKKLGIEQNVFLSHYPALSWPGKGRGSIHLHGHVHGAMDEFNEQSTDLRVDVGLDSKFSYMKLVSFEDVYSYMVHKAGDIPLMQYMNNIYNKNKDVII